jgi:hypothetical protein
MKIAESTIVVQSSGVQSEAFFTVKDKNVGHIFSILRNKLYSNKPLASVNTAPTHSTLTLKQVLQHVQLRYCSQQHSRIH